MVRLTHFSPVVVACCLSACSLYHSNALPTQFSLPDKIPHLVVDQKTLPFASMREHTFDPANGLDSDDVAIVAVINNPDLKLARDDAGVARAQAFSAGLLPDPQLSLSRDLSNTGGPGSSKAYSTGLSIDLLSLVTYSANNAAAQADIKKTDLNLLWQEWQVAAQARLLYIKLMYSQKIRAVLESNRALFTVRANHSQQAYAKNLISNESLLPDLGALQDVQRQSNDLERQINQYRHDLNSLLGLSPEAEVQLRESAPLAELNEQLIVQEAGQLAQHRPDLLALQSGFEAQDQRYRAALLAQFPALSIGFTRARDSSGIYSTGLGVTLSLPLFNRNRGNIAIEEASRDRLVDDYQLRLDSANSDIHKLLADQRINTRQLLEIQAALAQFDEQARNADTAYQKNIVDTLIYTNAHTTLMARQIEALNLQQSIEEQRIALQTLIGGDLPVQLHSEKN